MGRHVSLKPPLPRRPTPRASRRPAARRVAALLKAPHPGRAGGRDHPGGSAGGPGGSSGGGDAPGGSGEAWCERGRQGTAGFS